ncbi:hypothetical protein CEXT_53981 [Caerostris extrusa]|uniref:Uncharacterized protein n=1 Tax=Caerostris extrusa TaxID=172846 RepID=A0AAV4TTZ5_CAEEX|nr:hypothetical protein CEXT_53981 [Caerostris extrusa]
MRLQNTDIRVSKIEKALTETFSWIKEFLELFAEEGDPRIYSFVVFVSAKSPYLIDDPNKLTLNFLAWTPKTKIHRDDMFRRFHGDGDAFQSRDSFNAESNVGTQ